MHTGEKTCCIVLKSLIYIETYKSAILPRRWVDWIISGGTWKNIPLWRNWLMKFSETISRDILQCIDITRSHQKASLKKKNSGGHAPGTPLFATAFASVRRKPRFGVRIFIVPDSNFFQCQKHWKCINSVGIDNTYFVSQFTVNLCIVCYSFSFIQSRNCWCNFQLQIRLFYENMTTYCK